MFGKRPTGLSSAPKLRPVAAAPAAAAPTPAVRANPPPALAVVQRERDEPPPSLGAPATTGEQPRSDDYYQTKSMVFGALIEAIDVSQLAKLDTDSAREEIRDIVSEIIRLKNVMMSIAEQEDMLDDICNDVL